MPAKMIPATIADKPAQRMSFGVVIFMLLSLLFPCMTVVWRLAFMCLSPLSNDCDPCPCCHPARSPVWDQPERPKAMADLNRALASARHTARPDRRVGQRGCLFRRLRG